MRNERFKKGERGSTRNRLYLRESGKRPLASDMPQSQRNQADSNRGASNQQPHGGDRASELTQTLCGIIESELWTFLAYKMYRTFPERITLINKFMRAI
ncbi:hypothetical protein TNCV_3727241 [Trichonephila clavipes]|uniref:Uncharacterized protein n=1 Tax=Trichonephila clavipes TaxID=2585209 RepID=A0A8X6R2Q7_TRICX|nr:hypothetical protein TNCV_3727241 [Trichonephila clavipes]